MYKVKNFNNEHEFIEFITNKEFWIEEDTTNDFKTLRKMMCYDTKNLICYVCYVKM